MENGGVVKQETRLFDSVNNETRSMRSKEDAHDYRYFRDPDLLPLRLEAEFVDGVKNSMPELPDAKKARYVSELGLTPYDASVIVAEKATATYFEEVISQRSKVSCKLDNS